MPEIQAAPPLQGEDSAALIRRAALFEDLPAAVLEALGEISRRRVYQKGEPVFAIGQFDGAEFFFVATGRLKAAIADAAGAMLFETVPAGGFFALAEAVSGCANSRAERATLTAEEDSEVFSLDAAAFLEIVTQRPSLTRNLMQHFARALALEHIQAELVEPTPERRVFAALMCHVERDAVSGDWRIVKMPKHREIAEASGVDEPAAAAAIAQLIQDGVARREYPGLVIEDMARFGRLAA